jgi:hypothetical protein
VTLSDDLSSRAVGVGGTSVATIFLVAVVYGWAAAAVAAFLAMALVEVARRRPISRIALNCGIYVLASIAAAAAFYLVDSTLLSAVLSRLTRGRFVSSLRGHVYATLAPFALLASLAVILVVLWDQSPFARRRPSAATGSACTSVVS